VFVDDISGGIHYEDPFATPPEDREPVRRLRGTLASGVTVWTAGPSDARTGLTVSSVLLAEGEPSHILGLVNGMTSLYESLQTTERFVMHVLASNHKIQADRFAGLRPSPGGLFTGVDVTDSEWGPVIAGMGNRAYCKMIDSRSAGYQELVRGEIERIELTGLEAPLVFFRGRYRTLST
jgi:3-hydroxy-9,10-secoandrosta-1,3,5(10)-triene-9,17-dione monooxygenase reductase component